MRNRLGIGLVLTSAAAFGTMGVIARHATAAGLTVSALMLLRFAIASAILWIVVAARGQELPRGKPLLTLILMGGVLYFGQSFTYFSALNRIPVAMTSLLLYLYPPIVLVVSVLFLREPMSRIKYIGLFLALIGTALTIGPLGNGNPVGIALGMASAVFYATYILVGSKALVHVGALAATTVIMTSCGVAYGIFGIIDRAAPPSTTGLLWAALLALVSLVAIGTFLAGLEKIGPVNASTLSALEPVVTATMGALFLSESLLPIQLLGGALILGTVVLLSRSDVPVPEHAPET